MKTILSLGIANPLVRVLVWLFGTCTMSLGAIIAGAAGALLIAIVFIVCLLAHVLSNGNGGGSSGLRA